MGGVGYYYFWRGITSFRAGHTAGMRAGPCRVVGASLFYMR